MARGDPVEENVDVHVENFHPARLHRQWRAITTVTTAAGATSAAAGSASVVHHVHRRVRHDVRWKNTPQHLHSQNNFHHYLFNHQRHNNLHKNLRNSPNQYSNIEIRFWPMALQWRPKPAPAAINGAHRSSQFHISLTKKCRNGPMNPNLPLSLPTQSNSLMNRQRTQSIKLMPARIHLHNFLLNGRTLA